MRSSRRHGDEVALRHVRTGAGAVVLVSSITLAAAAGPASSTTAAAEPLTDTPVALRAVTRSARTTGAQEDPASRLQALAFLAGRWRGDFEGAAYEEIYSSPEGDKILWLSKTYDRDSVVAFEFGTIEVVAGRVLLTPYVNGQRSVGFTLVELDSSSSVAVFANPEHDFPTRLEYRLVERDHLRIVLKGPEGESGPVLTADLQRQPR